MKTLAKPINQRGPAVLWTGPGQDRLLAEVFPVPGGVAVCEVFWPEQTSAPAARFIPREIISEEHDGRGPVYLRPMEPDDDPALVDLWERWTEARDQDGYTREDAREQVRLNLDLDPTPEDDGDGTVEAV